jgi:hypothetical protein
MLVLQAAAVQATPFVVEAQAEAQPGPAQNNQTFILNGRVFRVPPAKKQRWTPGISPSTTADHPAPGTDGTTYGISPSGATRDSTPAPGTHGTNFGISPAQSTIDKK